MKTTIKILFIFGVFAIFSNCTYAERVAISTDDVFCPYKEDINLDNSYNKEFPVYLCDDDIIDNNDDNTDSNTTDNNDNKPSAYYIEFCGNYKIGTEWLKGYLKNTRIQMKDYYDYSPNAETVNRQNLQNFFRAKTVSFKPVGTSAITTEVIQESTITNLLNDYCINFYEEADNNSANITFVPNFRCAKCPNNGKVPGRSKYTWHKIRCTGYDEGTNFYKDIVQPTGFEIYTIADCYQDTYKDSSGTFHYLDENYETQTCQYAGNISGTSIQ